jgi:hypothetical protein
LPIYVYDQRLADHPETVLIPMVKAKSKRRQKLKMSKQMQETSLRMDALAKKLGKWDPQSIVRKFRDSNLSGKS